MAHIYPLLQVYVVYSLHTVEKQLRHIFIIKFTGYMRSRPLMQLSLAKITMVLVWLVTSLKHVNRACPTSV